MDSDFYHKTFPPPIFPHTPRVESNKTEGRTEDEGIPTSSHTHTA